MRWIEPVSSSNLPPAGKAMLLRQMIEQAGGTADRYSQLGAQLSLSGDYERAAAAYQSALALDPANVHAQLGQASCWLKLKRYDAILALDYPLHDHQGMDAAAIAAYRGGASYIRGCALRKLNRPDEARLALLHALELVGDDFFGPLEELMALAAVHADGAALLALCDSLAPRHAAAAPALAHRALALSRMGRSREAMAIMNLERFVTRSRFVPPDSLGSIARFNRDLADEILTDPSPRPAVRPGVDQNATPRRGGAATAALHAFMRDALERYLDEMERLDFYAVMPPRPARGEFLAVNTVLRGDGHNGQHVHAKGYITAVYHVQIPDSIVAANDGRGDLILGCCDDHTAGYVPCWGTRAIRPEAGWVTIFPSHFFHDVVPSGTSAPRISVVGDLKPVED